MSKSDGNDYEEGEKKQINFDWMPSGCTALADGEYDAIVMGTGLTECIISGLLSSQGMRVLHVDRNNYYGADSASLSLNNMFQKFRPGKEPPSTLGHSRDWNIDLIPKFIMSCGKLVKILLHTKVTKYLEFKSVDGSYVFKDGKVQKVPATAGEALSSALLGFFEKRNFKNFLQFVESYEHDKPSTWQNGKNMEQLTARDVFKYWNLSDNTQSFTGHAMALESDDTYLDKPALPTIESIKLYVYSLQRYGKSPYIYPIYGLGGLPEGFSRLCAIHGGTFMLNRAVDELLTDKATGKAWGIKSGNEVAKAKFLVGDPSYFAPEKTRVVGKVIRSICLLDHPITGTDNAESVQIIIPASLVNRKNDIYVCMVSFAHMVASQGKYIAIVSTTIERSRTDAECAQEVQSGIQLLGNILERFDSISELREPVSDGKQDNCYITKSYDATSHFESQSDDVLSLYRRITGNELDMTISAELEEEDA